MVQVVQALGFVRMTIIARLVTIVLLGPTSPIKTNVVVLICIALHPLLCLRRSNWVTILSVPPLDLVLTNHQQMNSSVPHLHCVKLGTGVEME